jgi:pyruvate formate lyase activating enzyme
MEQAPLEIKGFLETSFVDWPGKVAAVVFLPGCNYRCPYCHNHRLLTEAAVFSTWPLDEVLGRLGELKRWVDGVCITGGEPTIHPGLPGLLEAFKGAGWAVKLDTNGSNPDMVRSILEKKLVTAVSLDVKAPLEPIAYRRNGGNGANPESVVETLKVLAGFDVPVELRTTVHPKLLSLDELLRLAAQTTAILGPGYPLKLQACRIGETLDPALAETEPPELETIDAWAVEVNRLTGERGAAKSVLREGYTGP